MAVDSIVAVVITGIAYLTLFVIGLWDIFSSKDDDPEFPEFWESDI